jgi:iron(III) transport system permease protein
MLWRGGDMAVYGAMAGDVAEGLRDTVPIVLAACVFCLALGWLLADMALERPGLGALALCLALISATVAPAVVGIGMIRFWNHDNALCNLVYGRGAILVLALCARFLAIWLLAVLAGRRMLGREFLEAARLADTPQLLRHTRLLGGALGPLLAVTAAVSAALMLGELGATTLLTPPGIELLSYRLHCHVHIGPESRVLAFSLIYGVLALGIGAAIWLVGARTLGAKGGARS